MEVSITRPMPPKSSGASATGAAGDFPTSTYRNSEYTSGRASTYAEQGPRSSDSGRETASQRQTEMKLMAMEPSDDLPPERVQDYKGRIRVRGDNLMYEP
ncbi:unnamed protein product [Phytophthora lilii]|uniref:Unnamed protein product n=1 Tax=Phytophthora lilii TaxID=2077276 RepID=A0A9W6U8K7_9STRA|nr:unnamed protein product [Phytophthora lilii]